MKRSAGAPASICFASALLAPYEMITLFPVAVSNCLAWSSMASFRLAAAKASNVYGSSCRRHSSGNANQDRRAKQTGKRTHGFSATVRKWVVSAG